jgi:hypothetical protein
MRTLGAFNGKVFCPIKVFLQRLFGRVGAVTDRVLVATNEKLPFLDLSMQSTDGF